LKAVQADSARWAEMEEEAWSLESVERERMGNASEEISAKVAKLQVATTSKEELQAGVDRVTRESGGLQTELELSGSFDAEQSARLESGCELRRNERSRLERAGEECRGLRTKVVELEVESKEVSAQLRAAELSERHNLEIREELRLHNEARSEMAANEMQLMVVEGEIRAETELAEQRCWELDDQLVELQQAHHEIYDSIVKAGKEKNNVNDELSRWTKERKDLEFAAKQASEAGCQQRRTLEKDYAAGVSERNTEREHLEKLQTKSDAYREEDAACKLNVRTARDRYAELENECNELRESTEELDEQAAAIRAQGMCAMS